jgi:cytochrome c oxidase subunit II
MRHRSRRLIALLIGFVLIASGCASDAPLDTLDPAGRKAESIDSLFMGVFYVATIIFVLVFGAVAFISWKYRVRKPGPDDTHFAGDYPDEEFPEQVHGNFQLEIGWTIAPTVIMAVVAVFTLSTWFGLQEVEAAPETSPYPDMEILVVGHQWWWEFQYYLDGDTSKAPDLVVANEMVIPVEQDIQIYTTSRDVIHSFWIPRLNGKKDAAPGRLHPWTVQSNEVGRFAGQCTEFCGLSHAYMRMYTVAVSHDDFASWVDNQATVREPLTEEDPNYEAEQLFMQQCARCHVIFGVTERDRDGDGEPELDDLEMYGDIEEYRNLPDLSMGMYTGPENLTAGAAPNLTHFATRSSYAGSFFELYADAQEISDRGDYLTLPGSPYFRAELEAWLRNSPAEKPNAQPEQPRGMPNLGLSEADIDALVDYLLILD